jgi:beta-N-acetylhexosaminidase
VYAIERLKAEGLIPEETEPLILNIYTMTAEEMIRAISQAQVVIAVSALYGEAELDPNTEDGIESAIMDLLLQQTHAHDGRFVLISAQFPYDAGRYPEADAVLACYSARGMAAMPGAYEPDTAEYGPNLPAAVYTVFGGNKPTGKLPVNIPGIDENYRYAESNAYERGFGLSY